MKFLLSLSVTTFCIKCNEMLGFARICEAMCDQGEEIFKPLP